MCTVALFDVGRCVHANVQEQILERRYVRRQQRCIREEVNTDAHVATYDQEYPQTIEMVFVAWVLFIHILLHIVWILDLVGTYQYCISVYLFTYRSDTGIANFHTRWVLVLDWYVPFHIPIWSWYLTGIGPKADLCLV